MELDIEILLRLQYFKNKVIVWIVSDIEWLIWICTAPQTKQLTFARTPELWRLKIVRKRKPKALPLGFENHMSDQILHECGIALVRLRKPSVITSKNTARPMAWTVCTFWWKTAQPRARWRGHCQHQTWCGPYFRYISRHGPREPQPVATLFKKLGETYARAQKTGKEKFKDEKWLKENVSFTGELWFGHLRYGTHGQSSIENVHPFLRQNNWRSRNLVMAGNFNMTNVDQLFDIMVNPQPAPERSRGYHYRDGKIGHFLDEEVQDLFQQYKERFSNREVSDIIENEIDLQRVLKRACKDFDGGYAMAGLIGSGSAFVVRDPNGIRPAYYYADDEVVVVASEKPAIKTAFNIEYSQIEEVKPGHALIINKNGDYAGTANHANGRQEIVQLWAHLFSRGNDPDIYRERKTNLFPKYWKPSISIYWILFSVTSRTRPKLLLWFDAGRWGISHQQAEKITS